MATGQNFVPPLPLTQPTACRLFDPPYPPKTDSFARDPLRNHRHLAIAPSSAFLVGGLTASLVIQDRAEGKLRESDAVLRQQDYQLAVLAAEHQRLSNLVAQANSSSAEDQLAELAKLRSQAEAFRKQTNELGKQLAENRRSRPW